MMYNYLIFFTLIVIVSTPSDGYDPLDSSANITIKWDILRWAEDRYDATVSILNYQLYRHIERPGWKLSWVWNGDDVIWKMQGAEATEQGNCSAYSKSPDIPHCCEKKPTIIDLLPGAGFNLQTKNCCKGGVLTSLIQDPSKSGATFQLTVGSAAGNASKNIIPNSFDLGIPGYSCGPPLKVPPSRFSEDNGRRWTQALDTWNVTCTYSQFLASSSPKCCVSLSAFYSSTIVPCSKCSCGCRSLPGVKCVKDRKTPPVLQLPKDREEEPPPLVDCSQHMCPIRIHWHVKVSYKEYWRVKMTIVNLNYAKNYSQWSLVVQHPNLKSIYEAFSFHYKSLDMHGKYNDTTMFWGIQYYNEMLLSSDKLGNVQSEILLHKDYGEFTFTNGWAFPSRIAFNGDECVMPSPDEYPKLPDSGHNTKATSLQILSSLLILVMLI